MSKKTVEITLKVLVEYDSSVIDEEEVKSSAVVCFYDEDTFGIESYLPKTDTMEILEYIV